MGETRYSLRLSSAHVVGVVPLPSATLSTARAFGEAWKRALKGSAQPFTLVVINERQENVWSL